MSCATNISGSPAAVSEKALTMAKGGVPITELARVIWICSDEVPYFDILTAISTSGYTENKNKEEQVDE